MKKIEILRIFFLFLIFPVFLLGESIKNYDVFITIQKDGILNISENINYNFDGRQKHGIYRKIPLKFGSEVEVFNVLKNRKKENFDIFDEAEYKIVKIGKQDVLLENGIYNYQIDYKMKKAITEYRNQYEIYFNGIGQEWGVPIEKANIVIKMENGKLYENGENSNFEVYTGKKGERNQNFEARMENGEIFISNLTRLNENEGISFIIHLDKNKFDKNILNQINNEAQRSFEKERNDFKNLALRGISLVIGFIILMALSIYVWVYYLKAKNTKYFDEELSPVEVAYLSGNDNLEKLTEVAILSLLKKKCISIKEKTMKMIFISEKDELPEEEKIILEAIRNNYQKEDKFYEKSLEMKKMLEKKYRNLKKDSKKYYFPFFLGVIILSILFFTTTFENLSIYIGFFIFFTISYFISLDELSYFRIIPIFFIGILLFNNISKNILYILEIIYFWGLFEIFNYIFKNNSSIKKWIDELKKYIEDKIFKNSWKMDRFERRRIYDIILPYSVALHQSRRVSQCFIKEFGEEEYKNQNVNFFSNNLVISEVQKTFDAVRVKWGKIAGKNKRFGSGRSFGGSSGGGFGGGGGGSW
jgi:putative transmembrane signal peptide protein